jgi:hypothetical protein
MLLNPFFGEQETNYMAAETGDPMGEDNRDSGPRSVRFGYVLVAVAVAVAVAVVVVRFGFAWFTQEEPASEFERQLFAPAEPVFQVAADGPVTLRSGGEVELPVEVLLGLYDYLLVNLTGPSLRTATRFSTSIPGWAVLTTSRPEGSPGDSEVMLMGTGTAQIAGTYMLALFETLGRDPSEEVHSVAIDVETQICRMSNCRDPQTVTMTVDVRVNAPRVFADALPKSTDGVAWIEEYDEALATAASSEQAVFVVITAPTWCGFCVVLERDVFSYASVAGVLNEQFVPLRLLDTNPDRYEFEFSGYPTMYIAASDGSVVQRINGRTEAAFLAEVRPYERTSNQPRQPVPTVTFTYAEGEFVHTGDEWVRREGGSEWRYRENKRDDNFIVLEDLAGGDYLGIPASGIGAGYILRDGAWVEAFQFR